MLGSREFVFSMCALFDFFKQQYLITFAVKIQFILKEQIYLMNFELLPYFGDYQLYMGIFGDLYCSFGFVYRGQLKYEIILPVYCDILIDKSAPRRTGA